MIGYHQFIFISTCFVFLFVIALSIGYSSYSVSLDITGEAIVRADVPLRIIDNSIKSLDNGGTEKASSKYTVDTISNHIELPNCDSTVSYNIAVKNDNDYPIVLKSLNKEVWNNDSIDFEVIGYDFGNKVIESKSEITFELKFKNISCDSENKKLDSILKLEIDTFNIIFNPNYSGSTVNTVQIINSDYTEYFNDLPRTGYNFLGSYTDPIDGTKITADNISSISNNQELYAHWDPINLTITYIGFDDISLYPKTIKYGSTLNITMDESITNFKVFKDKTLLLKNQGYTFNNNIFIMENVQNDITIENVIINYPIVQDGLITYSNINNSSETKFGDMIINGGESLLYGDDGSLKMTKSSPIVYSNIGNLNLTNGYSINITVKGSVNQITDKFPSTVLAISADNKEYLLWVGFINNYINVYSYYMGDALQNQYYERSIPGFLSTDVSMYDNQVMNIQIIAEKGGMCNLYINGVLFKTFQSGTNDVSYKLITIGDLRIGRGLKYTGNIYDFAFYNRKLTDDEVQKNYKASIENYNKYQ